MRKLSIHITDIKIPKQTLAMPTSTLVPHKLCPIPGEVPRVLVHFHLHGLEVVEFLADGRLVARREARPRLVGATVVLVSRRHLDVVVEADDLRGG